MRRVVLSLCCLLALFITYFAIVRKSNASAREAARLAAKITSNVSKTDGIEIKYWIFTGMRPLLEAETNTNAYMVRLSCERNYKGELESQLWTNKAKHSLQVKWNRGLFSVEAPFASEDGAEPRDLTEVQKTTGGRLSLGLGSSPKTKIKSITHSIRTQKGWYSQFAIPYDHTGYMGYAAYIEEDEYPIGIIPKMHVKSPTLASLLLVDLVDEKLVAETEIELGGRPYFYIDRERNIVIAIDFFLEWMVAIDLDPYMKSRPQPKE